MYNIYVFRVMVCEPHCILPWASGIMPWFPARVPEQTMEPSLKWGKHRRVRCGGGRAATQLVHFRTAVLVVPVEKTAAVLSPSPSTPAAWTFSWAPQVLPLSSN